MKESHLWEHDRLVIRGRQALVGVDEAGRGALAGPVMAAAVYCERSFLESVIAASEATAINDSKQLSAADRAAMVSLILGWRKAGMIRASWAVGSVEEIATHNILGATRLAMQRSIEALSVSLPTANADLPLFREGSDASPLIFVDGRPLKPFPYPHQALVQGDGKSFCIAAASILAKVERDRIMTQLCEHYPRYGFSRHKGYGTKQHREAICEMGPCPEHRELFLRKVMARE